MSKATPCVDRCKSFRSHSPCGWGKTVFQQVGHIWACQGGVRQEFQKPHPYGREKAELQQPRPIWANVAGQSNNIRNHAPCGWGKTDGFSNYAIYEYVGERKGGVSVSTTHAGGVSHRVPASTSCVTCGRNARFGYRVSSTSDSA